MLCHALHVLESPALQWAADDRKSSYKAFIQLIEEDYCLPGDPEGYSTVKDRALGHLRCVTLRNLLLPFAARSAS